MENFIFCVVKYTAITKTDIRKYATWKVGLQKDVWLKQFRMCVKSDFFTLS